MSKTKECSDFEKLIVMEMHLKGAATMEITERGDRHVSFHTAEN
jgi:hypothetical protein